MEPAKLQLLPSRQMKSGFKTNLDAENCLALNSQHFNRGVIRSANGRKKVGEKLI